MVGGRWLTAPVVARDTDPLDNPAYAALTGPHRRFAEAIGAGVLRYPAEVCPFFGVPYPIPDWRDPELAAAIRGRAVTMIGQTAESDMPSDWTPVFEGAGVQMVLDDAASTIGTPPAAARFLEDHPAVEVLRLGDDDVPDMLDLVARTQPGPFEARTIDMGFYLGVRDEGKLVAMAGERLRPPGWTEISAVCTDPAYRGRGLAAMLVLRVAQQIRERGDGPFLHSAASNTNAIGLYEHLGFRLRRRFWFRSARVPHSFGA